MLDVTRLVMESWDKVTDLVIARCWIKSEALPKEKSDELNSVYGRMKNSSKDDDFKSILSDISKLSINCQSELKSAGISAELNEDSLRDWAILESRRDVKEALLCDLIEGAHMPREDQNCAVKGATSQDKDTDVDNQDVSTGFPSLESINSLFKPIEEHVERLKLSSVKGSLAEAKKGFLDCYKLNRQNGGG